MFRFCLKRRASYSAADSREQDRSNGVAARSVPSFSSSASSRTWATLTMRRSSCAIAAPLTAPRIGPGPDSFWDSVGTTLERELSRYDAVVHLRTPSMDGGYNNGNPLRTESAPAAAEIDATLLKIWEGHRGGSSCRHRLTFSRKPRARSKFSGRKYPSAAKRRCASFSAQMRNSSHLQEA